MSHNQSVNHSISISPQADQLADHQGQRSSDRGGDPARQRLPRHRVTWWQPIVGGGDCLNDLNGN